MPHHTLYIVRALCARYFLGCAVTLWAHLASFFFPLEMPVSGVEASIAGYIAGLAKDNISSAKINEHKHDETR